MRRREFLGVLGGAAAAWPLSARGQHSGMPVVAILSGSNNTYPTFTKGLAELGYEHGRNVSVEYHSAGGSYGQLPGLAQELVNRKVAVIAAFGIQAAKAAKDATSSIPIVFIVGVDPIKFGFVRNLNRPGENVTGMTLYTSELHEKRVGLLHELIPNAAPIGMIINPNMKDNVPQIKSAEIASHAKGHPLVVAKASIESEIDAAFASFSNSHVAGILAVSDNFLNSRRDQIISLAAKYSIAMMYPFRADASAGGLLSYGTASEEIDRQAGIYAGKILKGEKPGELPIQQPTRFTLVINLKTAKTLGLTVPYSLLATADEVIE